VQSGNANQTTAPGVELGTFRPCFGCHPTPPPDHLNGAGLLWRISGGKITAMQSDWATIEIDGVQRIIHRRPSPANFVLPWRRRVP